MKVEIIRTGYGYKRGDIVEVPPYMARLLILKGFAKVVEHEPAPGQEEVKEKPKKKGKK